jgi:radical SAM protein with 4Fe4S-binding SPASM domain
MLKKIDLLEIQLTNDCHFNCFYCGNEPKDVSNKKVDYDKLIDIINYLNPNKISFTGGEPLIMFEKLIKLINFVKTKNILTQVNTNGDLLTEDKIEKLHNSGLDIIHISLSTMDQELYDSIRRINKSNKVDLIVNNIKHITKTTKIKLVIEALLLKQNIKQIQDIYKFALDCNASSFEIQNLVPLDKSMCKFIPNEDDILSLFTELSKISESRCKIIICCLHLTKCFDFPDLRSFNNFEYYKCMCGNSSYYLSSNGDVFPCSFFHFSLGNILKDNYENIFENSAFKKMEMEMPSKCTTCDIFNTCRNTCISMVYLEHSNFRGHAYPVYKKYCEHANSECIPQLDEV